MKKLFICALALASVVACSKDDDATLLESSKKSVSITINNMASDTRAAGDITVGGEQVACAEASELYFLFANSAGSVVATKTIKDATPGTLPEGAPEGAVAYLFHSLPENVTQIGVIANVTSAPATLADAVALWQNEVNQVAAQYTDIVAYSTPSSGNGIALVQKNNAYCELNHVKYPLFEASVNVTPYLARIEIDHIGCTDLGQTANDGYSKIGIKSLSLAGGDLMISDAINGSATKVNTSNAAYTHTLGTFANDAAVTGQYALLGVHDHDNATNLVAPAATEDGKKQYWSWNILPQKVSDLTMGIYVVGNNYTVPVGSADKTVTVRTYSKDNTNITSFDAQNIYRFWIDFSEKNIDETNNYICVDVDVTIAKWVVNNVNVGFANN